MLHLTMTYVRVQVAWLGLAPSPLASLLVCSKSSQQQDADKFPCCSPPAFHYSGFIYANL